MGALRLGGLGLVLAASIFIAGCGGGGGDSPQADDGSLSKAEFVKKADAVCASGEKEVGSKSTAFLKKNGLKEVSESSPAQGEELIETVAIPALQRQVDEIRALGLPSSGAGEAEAFLNSADEAIETAEENPEKMFKEPLEVLAKTDEIGKKIGFKVCSN